MLSSAGLRVSLEAVSSVPNVNTFMFILGSCCLGSMSLDKQFRCQTLQISSTVIWTVDPWVY